MYKLRLNSWNTKYSKNVTCICGQRLSVHHLLLECEITKQEMMEKHIDIDSYDSEIEFLYSPSAIEFAVILSKLSMSKLL